VDSKSNTHYLRPLQKALFGSISLSGLNGNPQNIAIYSSGCHSTSSSTLNHIEPFADVSILHLVVKQLRIKIDGQAVVFHKVLGLPFDLREIFDLIYTSFGDDYIYKP